VGGTIFHERGITPLEISFFFLGFSLFLLAPFAVRNGLFTKVKQVWRILLIYSCVNTVLVLSQFTALALGLSAGVTALLLYLQPVWTILFGRIFFKERIDLVRVGVIVLALTGMVLVINPFQSNLTSGSQLISGTPTIVLGEIVAIIGGVCLSLWIILGKKMRLGTISDPVQLTFVVRGSSLIPIAIISIVAYTFGTTLFLASPSIIVPNLLPLFLYSVIAGTLPDLIFYIGVKTVSPSRRE